MRKVLSLIILTSLVFASKSYAGLELVCEGRRSRSNHRIVYVNCENRKEFIDMLAAAWRELRNNRIGGTIENMCWEAYSQARDMHPSISFSQISDSFFNAVQHGLGVCQMNLKSKY